MFIILIYKLSQVALAVKNTPANEADIRNSGSIPGLGRSSGEGNGNPIQYSCLGNLVDRGAWQAIVHGVTKSDSVQFSSVTQSCLTLCDPFGLQHARLTCPSLSPRVFSNSCPLSRWCHPTISSSATLFSSWPQSFLASGSFPMSQLFTSEWPNYWSFSISPSN